MSQDGINIGTSKRLTLHDAMSLARKTKANGELSIMLPDDTALCIECKLFRLSFRIGHRPVTRTEAWAKFDSVLHKYYDPKKWDWRITEAPSSHTGAGYVTNLWVLNQRDKPVAKAPPKAPSIVVDAPRGYGLRDYQIMPTLDLHLDFDVNGLTDPNRTAMNSRPRASWSVDELGTLTFSELMELVKDGEIGTNVARAAILSGPRRFTGLTAPAPDSEYAMQCSPMLLREEIDCLNRANRQHAETIEKLRDLNARRGSLIHHLISIMEIEQEDEADLPQAVMSLKRWAVSLEQQRNEFGDKNANLEFLLSNQAEIIRMAQEAVKAFGCYNAELGLAASIACIDAKAVKSAPKLYMSMDEVLELQAERQRKLEQRREDAKARR